MVDDTVHSFFYDSNYNLTHGCTIGPHHYAPLKSLGAEPQHYGMHRYLLNRNHDLTHSGAIDPRQHVPPQSPDAEPQYTFHSYFGGLPNNQAPGEHIPEEYSNYHPAYYAAPSERPASNHPSESYKNQGCYTPYGPPSQHHSSAVGTF